MHFAEINSSAQSIILNDILKKKFNEFCKYQFDKNGNLIGDSNCSICKNE